MVNFPKLQYVIFTLLVHSTESQFELEVWQLNKLSCSVLMVYATATLSGAGRSIFFSVTVTKEGDQSSSGGLLRGYDHQMHHCLPVIPDTMVR